MYDVVIVGYGPTGMLAAIKLGRAGHRVAVIERHKTLYTLPRVGIVHDDVLRMFQEVGIAEKIKSATHFLPVYELANKARVLLSNAVQPNATHGWPEFISIYQPAFEAELDHVAKSLPTVDVMQGQQAISVKQYADEVTVEIEDGDGAPRKIAARYLIGCDGGNSFVRGALGVTFEFLGFDQDWLVIDARMKRSPRPDLPMLRQFCEPDQPGMTMQMGAQHRRWSFMIFPDEPVEEAIKPENVWRRLNRPEGGTSDDFELIRVASYKFTSQIVDKWRVGQAFLAGDAAHLMPPFLAQGMCSGFRDAYNLSWKLDLVLKGLAAPHLLDTYEAERSPNARATIIESARVGQNVIERDPEKAKGRDARLIAMQAELDKAKGHKALIAFRVPGLSQGLVARQEALAAGDAFPQGKVRRLGTEGRFDDIVGGGFLILARNGDPASALSAADQAFWSAIGGRFVEIGAQTGQGDLTDTEGRYLGLMDECGCDVILKRPDYYIFGGCETAAQLPALLADLRAQLRSVRA
jgi:2-polyprenyl-6-methoxyphenol hydroxylase-like FAD-dependent oxidoreductase